MLHKKLISEQVHFYIYQEVLFPALFFLDEFYLPIPPLEVFSMAMHRKLSYAKHLIEILSKEISHAIKHMGWERRHTGLNNS